MSQVAKLHIRGNLVNTLQNLTLAEGEEAQNAASIAFNDSALGAARTEFCAALGRTIGNEYKDVDVALGEVYISFWISSVDVLFHRPKKFIIELISSTCAKCKYTSIDEANERRKFRAAKYSKKTPETLATLNKKITEQCAECGSTERLVVPTDFILKSADEAERIYTEMTENIPPARDRTLIDVPVQRKKFYQTCLFNYLRQILRENTYPKALGTVIIKNYAERVFAMMIKSILDRSANFPEYSVVIDGDVFECVKKKKTTWTAGMNTNITLLKTAAGGEFDPGSLPLTTTEIDEIQVIKRQAEAYGVEISINDPSISIVCTKATPVISGNMIERTRVHQISLDTTGNEDNDNSYREHIESQSDDVSANKVLEQHDVDYNDCHKVIRSRLNDGGQRIFDAIVHPTEAYVKKYGNQPCKRHIAEFLGVSPKEVQRQWDVIELQMRAVDLVPR